MGSYLGRCDADKARKADDGATPLDPGEARDVEQKARYPDPLAPM